MHFLMQWLCMIQDIVFDVTVVLRYVQLVACRAGNSPAVFIGLDVLNMELLIYGRSAVQCRLLTLFCDLLTQ